MEAARMAAVGEAERQTEVMVDLAAAAAVEMALVALATEALAVLGGAVPGGLVPLGRDPEREGLLAVTALATMRPHPAAAAAGH